MKENDCVAGHKLRKIEFYLLKLKIISLISLFSSVHLMISSCNYKLHSKEQYSMVELKWKLSLFYFCPELFQCPRDGYFRDPHHCDVYYICASGNSMRMTCDPGTSFDLTFNLCLWSSEVHDCNVTSIYMSQHTVDSTLISQETAKDSLKATVSRNESVKGRKCLVTLPQLERHRRSWK